MANSVDPDQLASSEHCLQRQGISGFSRKRVNEYPQHMFLWRYKKIPVHCTFVLKKTTKERHSGSVVERPLCDREVAGSIPGRVIPKTLKMVLAALSLGAQH